MINSEPLTSDMIDEILSRVVTAADVCAMYPHKSQATVYRHLEKCHSRRLGRGNGVVIYSLMQVIEKFGEPTWTTDKSQ
ncbi:MAG: hypothetical protein WC734_06185 [Patescibacteria group bacterium]|jgi:protoheme ferro-lyase